MRYVPGCSAGNGRHRGASARERAHAAERRRRPVDPLDRVLSHPAPDALPKVSLGGAAHGRGSCGCLNCTQRFAPLFDALPSILVVRRRTEYGTVEPIGGTPHEIADVPRESSAWLATTLKFTASEAAAARPGNAAMLGRLTELMFVAILREYVQQLSPRERGWLAALSDPYVGTALRLLHESPTRPWTVGLLAHEVAISRSGLAQRFTRLVGESPMKYLGEWRIELAKQMLRDRGTTSRPSPSGSATSRNSRSTARSRRRPAVRRPSGAGPPVRSRGSTDIRAARSGQATACAAETGRPTPPLPGSPSRWTLFTAINAPCSLARSVRAFSWADGAASSLRCSCASPVCRTAMRSSLSVREPARWQRGGGGCSIRSGRRHRTRSRVCRVRAITAERRPRPFRGRGCTAAAIRDRQRRPNALAARDELHSGPCSSPQGNGPRHTSRRHRGSSGLELWKWYGNAAGVLGRGRSACPSASDPGRATHAAQ